MKTLGNYELVTRLATGGMAEAYVARNLVDGSIAVVKQLLPKHVGNPEFVEMFLDEGRVISSLAHPNVVAMKEFGFHEELPYLAMEYLHGVDLRTLSRTHLLRKKQLLPLDVVLFIVSSMLDGLQHAHEARSIDGRAMEITHRDVSPQNVVVTFDGRVKLIDFGIAKARGKSNETRSGALKGKIPYMSPEQVRSSPIDRRTDIYASGIVLYELVVGRRPYLGRKGQMSEFTLMMAIANHQIVAPRVVRNQLPEILDRTIMRALAAEPQRRYQSAAEMNDALRDCARQLGAMGTPQRLSEVMTATLGTSTPDAEQLKTNAGVVKLITDLEHSKTTVDERFDPEPVDPAEVGVASTDKIAKTDQGPPPFPDIAIERLQIVDKVVEANVTRLKFQRPISPGFRWGKLLDGIEGVVEIDFSGSEITGVTSLAAALEALRNLGREVSELRLSAVPIALAAQLDERVTILSVSCRGRCPACNTSRETLLEYDELRARLADGGAISCGSCGSALEDLELIALGPPSRASLSSVRMPVVYPEASGAVRAATPIQRSTKMAAARVSSSRANVVALLATTIAVGAVVALAVMWRHNHSHPLPTIAGGSELTTTGRIWQDGDHWLVEPDTQTGDTRQRAIRVIIMKLEQSMPPNIRVWAGSASDPEAVANFEAALGRLELVQVGRQYRISSEDLARAQAYYTTTREAWGLQLVNAPATRSLGVIVINAPSPGPIVPGDRVISADGVPIRSLAGFTPELMARSELPLVVEHREQKNLLVKAPH